MFNSTRLAFVYKVLSVSERDLEIIAKEFKKCIKSKLEYVQSEGNLE